VAGVVTGLPPKWRPDRGQGAAGADRDCDEAAEPAPVEDQQAAEAIELEAPVDSAVEAVSPQTVSSATRPPSPLQSRWPLSGAPPGGAGGHRSAQVAGTGRTVGSCIGPRSPAVGRRAAFRHDGRPRRRTGSRNQDHRDRRKIAERRMPFRSRAFPHITYVEESTSPLSRSFAP